MQMKEIEIKPLFTEVFNQVEALCIKWLECAIFLCNFYSEQMWCFWTHWHSLNLGTAEIQPMLSIPKMLLEVSV